MLAAGRAFNLRANDETYPAKPILKTRAGFVKKTGNDGKSGRWIFNPIPYILKLQKGKEEYGSELRKSFI